MMSGSDSTTATSSMRPPMIDGPTLRQDRSRTCAGSSDSAKRSIGANFMKPAPYKTRLSCLAATGSNSNPSEATAQSELHLPATDPAAGVRPASIAHCRTQPDFSTDGSPARTLHSGAGGRRNFDHLLIKLEDRPATTAELA